MHLTKARKMISHFDRSKLSKDGYVVLIEDIDVTLPSGEVVPDRILVMRSSRYLNIVNYIVSLYK